MRSLKNHWLQRGNSAHTSPVRWQRRGGARWLGQADKTTPEKESHPPLPASAAAASDAFPFPAQLEVTPSALPSASGDSLLTLSSEDGQPRQGRGARLGWVTARTGTMAGMGRWPGWG